MKKIKVLLFSIGLTVSCYTQAVTTTTKPDAALEVRGTLKRYLMNPRGDVNGLLLTDGTQVKFPPQMSAGITAVIAPNDEITIKGFKENSKVFSAESITSTKTSKTVAAVIPDMSTLEQEDIYGRPFTPPHKGMKNNSMNHKGLKEMSSMGKIQTQLFDRRGRVVGAILSNDNIVHFRMHAQDKSNENVNVDVGQDLRASGFGTENTYGKSIEAVKISNK